MQRTWWPEAGTIIVTGPYCMMMIVNMLTINEREIGNADNTYRCPHGKRSALRRIHSWLASPTNHHCKPTRTGRFITRMPTYIHAYQPTYISKCVIEKIVHRITQIPNWNIPWKGKGGKMFLTWAATNLIAAGLFGGGEATSPVRLLGNQDEYVLSPRCRFSFFAIEVGGITN